jgi:hypothetical protein
MTQKTGTAAVIYGLLVLLFLYGCAGSPKKADSGASKSDKGGLSGFVGNIKGGISGLFKKSPAKDDGAQKPKDQSSLVAALSAAADVVIARLQQKTTIAVVSVASQDIESANFVVDELAYIIVSTGNFKVVDRKSLDAIRSEQNFQTSGDVDDDSAVSIGKLLGANIVITGSISGVDSTRRLRLKALDVMTAEIVAMASEVF